MKTLLKLALVVGILIVASPATGRQPISASRPTAYKAVAGPFTVAVTTRNWVDAGRRNRPVPVKVYLPAKAPKPAPVVVFSHGLGGSREGYEYLGRHWASHGYVSVHLQHLGSDAAVWRGKRGAEAMAAMRRAAADRRNAVNRPRDVSFAIDELTRLNRGDAQFKGRLDLKRIGMAGHSFGAYTTLAAVGQSFGRRGMTLGDKRIKAAIPMSAPVATRGDLDKAYGGIVVPCLHMTGTRDSSIIGKTTIAQRRLPFDHSKSCRRYMVTFAGGDHMVFSGVRRRGDGSKDSRFHDLIRQSTTAFWDAYLKRDAKAEGWLARGGFAAVMGRDGKWETARAAQSAAADEK